jgi:Rps23 Pro-64 3,4-dihydroxylase Tpa1-like proline 4-hydroxylase
MLIQPLIIDNFLAPEAADALLDYVLAREADFSESGVHRTAAQLDVPISRRSLSLKHGFEDALVDFHEAIDRRFDEICAGTSTAPFVEVDRDLDIVAHMDGHFYGLHNDTLTEDMRDHIYGDRMISVLYYFHRRPRAFQGGELMVHAIAGPGRAVVEAQHNRLVAFSSIAPHEVLPIDLPDNRFANARFAITCWLLRAKRAKP